MFSANIDYLDSNHRLAFMSKLLRITAVIALLLVSYGDDERIAVAAPSSCISGRDGGELVCGGTYITGTSEPIDQEIGTRHQSSPVHVHAIPMAPYVANAGPGGAPCIALGPADPTPNATVTAWLATEHLAACPAAKGAAGGPAWSVAGRAGPPLLAHHPTPRAPAGGTPGLRRDRQDCLPRHGRHGDTRRVPVRHPPRSADHPGPGYYLVDWGDGTTPTWTGPYREDGLAWPAGPITHVYDDVGSDTVVVHEVWTATWALAGDRGTLTGLATNATIAALPVRQIQAVITNG